MIALGIPEKNAIGVDFLNVATMLYDYINHTSELKDISDMNVVLNRIVLINSISQKQVSNLFEYKEDLQLSQSDIGTLYTLNFVTEKMQKDISDDLSGSNFSTISEFFDALTENFVLRAIENPDGSTNAKTVIMTLYKQIGIDNELINNASESVYRNVSNHYYSDYQALKKAFEDACNSKNNSNNGGVGTGKGSSNTGGNSIAAPNQNTSQLIQELPHDIFNDIAGVEWAKEAIVNLAEKGIIAGKGNNEFCPNDNITREEFVKMVVAAFFEDVEPKEISFSDITDDSWSKIYIMKAYGCGIISGYSDDLFGAKNHVTRQDMAVILYRAALKKGIEFDDSSSKTFQDENELPEYAIEAVNKLYNANIINGIESDVFGGRALATRAQAAKMIFGLISE